MDHDLLHMLNVVQKFVFYFEGTLMTLLHSEVPIHSYFYINGEGRTAAMLLDIVDCFNPSNPQNGGSGLSSIKIPTFEQRRVRDILTMKAETTSPAIGSKY